MFRQHPVGDELLAQIKQLAADSATRDKTLMKLVQDQLSDSRSVVRWGSLEPDASGKCRAQMPSTNTSRIKTILIVFDTTIGAITLNIGNFKRTFPNNTFGYIFLDNCDFVVGNSDEVSITAATWTSGKMLSLDVFGRQVGDAGYIA